MSAEEDGAAAPEPAFSSGFEESGEAADEETAGRRPELGGDVEAAGAFEVEEETEARDDFEGEEPAQEEPEAAGEAPNTTGGDEAEAPGDGEEEEAEEKGDFEAEEGAQEDEDGGEQGEQTGEEENAGEEEDGQKGGDLDGGFEDEEGGEERELTPLAVDDFENDDADLAAALPNENSGSVDEPPAGVSSPLITEVTKTMHEPQTPRRSSLRPPRLSRYNSSDYSDEELRRMFERMMKTRKCPPVAALLPLRRWISNEMLASVTSRKYDYGTTLKEGDALVTAFIKEDEANVSREARRAALIGRIDETRERLQTTDRELTESIGHWKADRADRVTELAESHEKEVGELETRWKNPDSLTEFKKPSQRLLVLRTTERRLAVMRFLERAKRIRAEAQAAEQTEAVKAESRAVAAMRIEYANLQEKQRREEECMAGWTTLKLEALEKRRSARVNPIQVTVARLSATAGQAAPRERKKVGVWPEYEYPESPTQVTKAHTARDARPGEPLELAGIEFKNYIKVKKPEKRQDQPTKTKKKSVNI
jgi:hypothetical protein